MKTKVIVSAVLFVVSFVTGKLAEKIMPFKEIMSMIFKTNPAKA